jgi:hypothetical protein
MNKLPGLLLLGPLLGRGQDSTTAHLTRPIKPIHTVYAGLQVLFNYAMGYRFQFCSRLSAQVQGGLIAAPFERYTLKLMTGFGLDPKLGSLIDRFGREAH